MDYVHYIPARTFSAEAIAARKLLADLGVDGSKPIAAARTAAGLGAGGLIPLGVCGEVVKRDEYAAEREARYAKPVTEADLIIAKINKKAKAMPKRRARPRMDSINAASPHNRHILARFRLN